MSLHPKAKGKGWVVRWREPGSPKNHQRSFDRKADAQRWEDEVRRRKQLGTLHTLLDGQQVLDTFVTEIWTPTYGVMNAPRTRQVYASSYDNHVAPTLGGRMIGAISGHDISQWQAALKRAGVGHDAILKARSVLSAVMEGAVSAQLIAVNPVRLAKAPPRPPEAVRPEVRPLAPATVEAVRARLGDRDQVLVSLLAYAGLRPGEARILTWGRVQERTLIVHAPKTRRHNPHPRTVRLLAPLAADLRAWRLQCGRPADDALVLLDHHGQPISYASLNRWRERVWAPALEAAGVPYQRPYDLRHSFASLLAHEGRPVTYIAAQLGHSAQESLRTYQHVIAELEDQPHVSAEDAIRAARENGGLRRAG